MSDDDEKCPCCGETGKIITVAESTSVWQGVDDSMQAIAKPGERIGWMLIASRDGMHMRVLSNVSDAALRTTLKFVSAGLERGDGVQDIGSPVDSSGVH